MRSKSVAGVGFRWAALAALAMGGCRGAVAPTTYVPRDKSLPPKTVALSTMMSDLSAQPGFTERMLDALGKVSKTGAAVLSPKLVHAMRVLILGGNWQGLDRFPGWGMGDINPVVDVSGAIDRRVAAPQAKPLSEYLDSGDYPLDEDHRVDLDRASTLPGFSSAGLVVPMGDSVTRGDAANPERAPMHSESMRLAEVLNRLSLNAQPTTRPEGVGTMTATLDGSTATTPEELVRALIASGHDVTVADARYFANFGHLHYEGNDVMMPFWVNTGVLIPNDDRLFLVPVAHAEYEWLVRGPKINADVAFYFGIDGKAEFRVMDTLDQAWVMGRHAHEYRGDDAVEVTRLTGLTVLAYAHAHAAHPRLPFGGYYALGVCQDSVAAIEHKMTGKATLFPNTADIKLFNDPRDAEINDLLAKIPKDRDGAPPQLERVFGSLPAADIATITIPGLADDLLSVQKAWRDGTLEYKRRPLREIRLAWGFGCAPAAGLLWFLLRRWRVRSQS